MEPQKDSHSCIVKWRGQNFIVEINSDTTLKALGEKLQKLTNVRADTLKLLVPTERSSKLLYPFSDEHSCSTLETAYVLKGKSIRMMGVPENEVDEVLKNEKADLRIAGFDEEEKRLRQRNVDRPHASWKLPQGTYVFCDFRTLSIPGMELHPPASKALELLHMLASDPGIVAIMNKHRWRVGILTEMAPIGYVGVSPKCILGFNKNCGEEISLRLRTDDLKGFRKYESIKKTLLHELAHMIHSEHDANFYALDKQLNKEASTLDWTKSGGHTLSGVAHSQNYEMEFDTSSSATAPRKLGGQVSSLPNVRISSVNAAFQRLAEASIIQPSSEEHMPDTDVSQGNLNVDEPDPDDSEGEISRPNAGPTHMPDNTESQSKQNVNEPDPDDSNGARSMELEDHRDSVGPDITQLNNLTPSSDTREEPNTCVEIEKNITLPKPELDEAIEVMQLEPGIDNSELQIIQDPVTVMYGRLQKSIKSLKHEVSPLESEKVLQMLVKIISNVTERPDELKFKKLRKANPTLQRNIVRYKAAMEILELVGFYEDAITDEFGRKEDFLVFKRNDPGLLWLVKSSLQSSII